MEANIAKLAVSGEGSGAAGLHLDRSVDGPRVHARQLAIPPTCCNKKCSTGSSPTISPRCSTSCTPRTAISKRRGARPTPQPFVPTTTARRRRDRRSPDLEQSEADQQDLAERIDDRIDETLAEAAALESLDSKLSKQIAARKPRTRSSRRRSTPRRSRRRSRPPRSTTRATSTCRSCRRRSVVWSGSTGSPSTRASARPSPNSSSGPLQDGIILAGGGFRSADAQIADPPQQLRQLELRHLRQAAVAVPSARCAAGQVDAREGPRDRLRLQRPADHELRQRVLRMDGRTRTDVSACTTAAAAAKPGTGARTALTVVS